MCVDKEKSVVQSVCVCVCMYEASNEYGMTNECERKIPKRFLKKKHVAFCLKSDENNKIICKNNKAK